MGAPRMQPHGTVNMTSHHKMDGALACFGYGEDDRAINPGDLLTTLTVFLTGSLGGVLASNGLKSKPRVLDVDKPQLPSGPHPSA